MGLKLNNKILYELYYNILYISQIILILTIIEEEITLFHENHAQNIYYIAESNQRSSANLISKKNKMNTNK